MTRTVALNTVAYQQVLEENMTTRQGELLHDIKALGFEFVEIRREYISADQEEMKQIAEIGKEAGLQLFYSVPDELFKGNKVNPSLEKYLKEAAILNALQMKLTLGQLNQLTKQTAEQLKHLLSHFSTRLLIENDQSMERGSSARLKSFMEEAAGLGLSLGLTFDVANFVYFNENPIESAKVLKPFVRYIHIKNVKPNNGRLEAVDMESGELDIQAILNEFPENITCAIEYPCGGQSTIKQKLEHDKKVIQSWDTVQA